MSIRTSGRFWASASALLLLLSSFPAAGWPESTPPGGVPSISAAPPAIVIGFVGGFVGRNSGFHGEVQLAKRLSSDYAPAVQVRTFENRRGQQARREILRLLDTDEDGTLSPAEKGRAQIVIYGHSWGASEAITLARRLAVDHIPVLLTVQVDSVQKWGEDDGSIPPNVIEATNFYQLDGMLHGRSLIRAVDASRTRIAGNFRFNYRGEPVNCEGFSWYARLFMKPHIEIESDPVVWRHVESLIRAQLPPIPVKQ
jgi:hypothetical protein